MKTKLLSLVVSLAALLATSPIMAQDKPERGKDFIEVPAMGEGLCIHNLFQSGMVLQRDKPVAIWGWATAGETVDVTFGGQTQRATAGDDRAWTVTFTAMAANAEGQTLTVKGTDKTLTLENILLGDVWVLGGQSNMEFDLAKIVDGQLEIASANFPKIRHITIPQQDGPEAKKGFPRYSKWSNWSKRHLKQGYWDVCTPETVRTLSGIGYVFARRLHMAAQVPIGVIDASRGGTTVETWTPLAELRKVDGAETKELLANWDKKVAEFDPQTDLENRIKRHNDWIAKMTKQGKSIPDNRKNPPTDLLKGPIMDQNKPGNCFASIIAPLAGLSVKGAIFHQGYNNCFWGDKGAKMYYQVFGTMITSWRAAFNDPQMPFGIISLCTGGSPQDEADYLAQMLDVGAYLRDAQYQTFLNFQKAGDKTIGFASSFDQRRSWYHPQIKVPVGERIAKWALTTQYGMKLKWEPPAVKEVKAEDGTLRVTLSDNVGPHNDGPILGFAIAGADGKFQMAKADYLVTGKDSRGRPQKDRKVIVLSSPLVPEPVHFRHAWARNPMSNLKANGIPLATVRSDSWTLEDAYKAYMGKDLKVPGEMDRGERGELAKALKAADLERRLYEARELIKTNEKKDTK